MYFAFCICIPLLCGCEYLNGNSPSRAALRMENENFADERRKGIIDLSTKFKLLRRPYTDRYRQIARDDPDYTVRAMAVRALNIARDQASTQLFIDKLADDNALVRLEAAKALSNVPDVKAIPALLAVLDGRREVTIEGRPEQMDEDKDVRIAAADALRHYRNMEVARTLVGYLGESDFGVAYQARFSLKYLTAGRDCAYDQAAWLKLLTGPEKPLG